MLFGLFAARKEFSDDELDERREHLFSKCQACFRASPLTKSYDWGIYNNAEGKIAMYGAETKEYRYPFLRNLPLAHEVDQPYSNNY